MITIAYALLAAGATLSAGAEVAEAEAMVAQLRIRQRVIIRVPALPAPTPAVPLPRIPLIWHEKRGPSCVTMAALAGAAITQKDAIDLYLRGGERMRAKLDDDCPALDYYGDFYVLPTKDGQICADRDVIHTRSGGQCEIVKFRRLVPAKDRVQR